MNVMHKCHICGRDVRTLEYHIITVHNEIPLLYYKKHINKLPNCGKCVICGLDSKFISIFKGYNKTCSKQCKQTKLSNDRSLVLIKKYGTDNIHQIPEIKSKIIATLNTNYGVDNPMKSELIRNKQHKTCVLLKHTPSDILTKRKIKLTFMKRYGGIGFAVPELRKKSMDNMKISKELLYRKITASQHAKYGGIGFASNLIKEKQRITMMKLYGVPHNVYINNNGFHNIKKGTYLTVFGDKLNYQSNLELLFIMDCLKNGLRILKGDAIPYVHNGESHIYYCDFKVLKGDKYQLILIKGNHPWYKADLDSGVISAKNEAAKLFSSSRGYLLFKFILEGNYEI